MLKSTGMVRQLDPLGRVVIPIELRRNLGIGEKDALEIFVNGEQIVLRKYAPGCIFCGSLDELHTIEDKQVCQLCRIKIGRTLGR